MGGGGLFGKIAYWGERARARSRIYQKSGYKQGRERERR